MLTTDLTYPSLNYDGYLPELADAGRNVYSQYGEDGLITAAFELFGTTNKWCFEFGAADGVFCSNTRLLVEQGWHAVWIEQDAEQYNRLLAKRPENVLAYCASVTPSNVDELLDQTPLPAEPDLGVIDVDGEDYWIWRQMWHYKPRLMCVEYSPYQDDQQTLVEGQQAPLEPILLLGDERGYRPIARTRVNVLFVQKDLL